MEVSVVVPLFNKVASVKRALDSIATQTFSDFEVIIVDDGSTDNSVEVVRQYRDSRFRLLTQPNRGPGAARNLGLAEVGAEFVAFLDADDEWLPNYLADGLALLRASGPDTVSVTSGYFEYPRGNSTERLWRRLGIPNGTYKTTPSVSPRRLISILAYMSPCTTIARTTTVRQYGGFYAADNCKYGEDAFLWLKFLLREQTTYNLAPLVNIHREDARLSKNLKQARPIEPFLKDPTPIAEVCPFELTPLFNKFLAARAFKTACVLGYWGHCAEAKALMRRYAVRGSWSLPYYAPALVCSTPLGAGLGKILRGF